MLPIPLIEEGVQHVHPVNKHLQSFLRSWTHEEISVQKSAITSLHVGNIPASIRISSSIDSEALPPEVLPAEEAVGDLPLSELGSQKNASLMKRFDSTECGNRDLVFKSSQAHTNLIKPDASGSSLML